MTRSFSQVFRWALAPAMAFTVLLFSASCGKSLMQNGDGSSYLVVGLLQAAPGATPTVFSTMLASDVVTIKAGTPTSWQDYGQIVLRTAMKDTSSDVSPTDTNTITITGYRVDYVRNDGGTSVPASFDGSLTATVTTSDTTVPFILVNAEAKLVAPLAPLAGASGVTIPVVAHLTFFGHDQAGHSATATASITIIFADWPDPTT